MSVEVNSSELDGVQGLSEVGERNEIVVEIFERFSGGRQGQYQTPKKKRNRKLFSS
jgi:hypothetical protein